MGTRWRRTLRWLAWRRSLWIRSSLWLRLLWSWRALLYLSILPLPAGGGSALALTSVCTTKYTTNSRATNQLLALLSKSRRLLSVCQGVPGRLGKSISTTSLTITKWLWTLEATPLASIHNAIESFNSVIRKAINKRKLFSIDYSARKVIFLEFQAASRNWMTLINNWEAILNQFMIEFEDRLIEYI